MPPTFKLMVNMKNPFKMHAIYIQINGDCNNFLGKIDRGLLFVTPH